MVTFKDVNLRLDEHPLIVVTGINHDSEARSNFNGVGKSVLFSALPALRYGSLPVTGIKRVAKKSLLRKDSFSEFEWEVDGKNVVVRQTPTKYHITYDGKDLKTHEGTQEVALNWIAKLFPIPEEAFYSYAYLHAQRSNIFQMAKPAERMKYLTNMYQLGIFDSLRQHFAKKVAEAKTDFQRAQVFASELQVVQTKLASVKHDPDELDRLERVSNKIQEQLLRALDDKSELRSLLEKAKTREDLVKRLEGFKFDGDERAELKALEKTVYQFGEYDSYLRAKEQYDDKHRSLSKKLNELGEVPSDDYSDQIDDLNAKLDSITDQLDELEEQQAQVKELRDRIAQLSDKKPKSDLERVESLIAFAQATIKIAEDFSDYSGKKCKCPTCMQNVDLSVLRKAADEAQSELTSALAERKKHKAYAEYLELSEELSKLGDCEDKIRSLTAQGQKATRQLRKLDAIVELQDKARSITSALKALHEPEEVDAPSTNLTRKEVTVRIRQLTRVLEMRAQLRKLPETKSVAEITEELQELDQFIERKKRSNASDKYQAAKLAAIQYEQLQEDEKRLHAELKVLGPKLRDQKLYEALYAAYSSKALKSEALDGLLSLIESELNALHPLTFPEPMEFRLFMHNGGVEAQVQRKSSGLPPSDINSLSGAESNCFSMLWALVMLVFTPAEMRPSFIIMDEPDHLCSPGLREHLVTEFLPKLMNVVPHVIWITPKDLEVFGDVPHVVISKRNGISSLGE